jgi:thiazole/oxazole-forming peptide maturase SagC family component
MEEKDEEEKYILPENVRIYTSEDEVRIRDGVWSFHEVVINLSTEPDEVRKGVQELFEKLKTGIPVSCSEIKDKHQLTSEKIDELTRLCEELKRKGLITTEIENTFTFQATKALLGEYIPELNILERKRILFFSDSSYAADAARNICNHLHIKPDIMGNELFNKLRQDDLTTKTDAISTIKSMEKYEKELYMYDCIIGCLSDLQVTFLRNLNRMLLRMEKPLSLGIIDGPFLSLLTIHPPQTGCLECFENRILSRMEDHVAYHRFVDSQTKTAQPTKTFECSPLLHMLVSMVISEGFLLSTIKKAKFTGRVLNIYLPIFEIQCQDILRLPFCPACGHVAKGKAEEMYINSRALINRLLEKITIERGDYP